jgi:hypothetical protein
LKNNRRSGVPIRYFPIFFWCASIGAQFTGHIVVRGELQIEGNDASNDYQVELADCAGGSATVRAWMSAGNRFEFPEVDQGCKTLRVLSGPQRNVVQEVEIFAQESSGPVVIRVANPERERVRGETVSVSRLRHPVPQKVARAIADSNRLWRAGQVVDAREKLRPLVAKYPAIWELRLNLGIIEMKLENVAEAAEHFSKARELEPRSPVAAVGSGFALFHLHRLEEAEGAAKDAIALEPGNQVARLLLARIQAARAQGSN